MVKESNVRKRTASKISADKLPMTEPESVGMSSERLSRIRVAMQRYIDKKLVPGVVTLVARKGRVVHLDAIGSCYVEEGLPMTTDTIFRIASMTKAITSVALMTLFEKGYFLLSDPVSNWIPEFTDPKVAVSMPVDRRSEGGAAGSQVKLFPANRPITIRHLLTHTAGFGYAPRGISSEE